ncbi:unnamed protein product [Bursaphelenchus okinawaensis]|uniref:Phosphoenolpyruvate synthase n=1 Tax=Bursaphelenchus okinawaensis TaxID=465554 RepID=A0A811LGN1_9BILA|nr:unnamed protein product [Bursaphelenchus okinawaensis]CAG9122044.1 unnamed protein product [Bursaphelenchus okinawaensis]
MTRKYWCKESFREFQCGNTEKERNVDKFKENDLVILQGSSHNDSVLMSLSVQKDHAQVYLCLILKNKKYIFEESSHITHDGTQTEITIDGFRIEIREAFRKLRVTFRGNLKAEGSSEVEFVHLQSWWGPVSDGSFVFSEIPKRIKASLKADKLWNNQEFDENETFYQFGVLRARWRTEENDWNEQDFRGFRMKLSRPKDTKLSVNTFYTLYTKNGNRSMFFFLSHSDRKQFIEYGKSLKPDHKVEFWASSPPEPSINIGIEDIKFNSGDNLILKTNKLKYKEDRDLIVTLNTCEEVAFKDDKVFEYEASEAEKQQLITSFSNFSCMDSRISGGKASNLAKLNGFQRNFKVPKGLAVSVNAYLQHLEENHDIKNFVNVIKLCSFTAEEIENRATSLFLSSKLSKTTKNALIDQLNYIFNNTDNVRFAVRSSAIGEDGAEMSSAGQLESYLNLKYDEIEENVLKCWSSNFRKEVVNYRREHGQDLNVPVAVVVQEMVSDGVSGVIFTVDPISLNSNHMVINMVEGCGEDLVSGHKTPTQVVYHKIKNEVLIQQGPSLISPSLVSKLVLIGTSLEDYFKYPQDIEFVLKKDTIYIVQSRNITNLNNESDWELQHEFDSSPLTDFQAYSTANVGEVLSQPFDVVDATETVYMLNHALVRAIKTINGLADPIPRHTQTKTTVYDNRSFLDIMECHLNDWQTCIDDTSHQIILAGTVFITDEMIELAKTRYPKKTGKDKLKAMYSIYKLIKKDSKRCLEEMIETLDEMKVAAHGNDLRSWLTTNNVLREYYAKLMYHHSYLSAFSSVMYSFVAMALRGTSTGTLSSDVLTAIATVYSNNLLPIISGDIPVALKDIALALKTNVNLLHVLNSNIKSNFEKVKILKSDDGEVGCKVREFYRKHGHRGLYELQMQGIPWNDDHDNFVATVMKLVSDPNFAPEAPKTLITDIDELIDSLKMNITGVRRRLLKFLIPHAFKAVFYREEAKSMLVYGSYLVRNSYKMIGKIMKEQHYLQDEKWIFFLTINEVHSIVNNVQQKHVISGRARRRLRLFNSTEKVQYPLISLGTPKPYVPSQPTGGVVLTGTAVCERRVKGRARVAKTLKDAQNITSDEILITTSTDIAWSPLFPVIKGLVTEIGGLLSHGSVVAREYGLPCVIAVQGATDVIKTGDHVLLDAFNGTLQRISTDFTNGVVNHN